ncbi:MAG: histidine--tRNA ligase, partial [Chitinophagaceae bacterium]
GLSDSSIELIKKFLSLEGNSNTKLNALRSMFNNDEEGNKGVEELYFVLNNTESINMEVDLTLARGLNYYTGTIFEVKAPENVKMGSIGGGGRYDDLTGLFGVPGVPGIGISFGVDRIYDVMQELSLFPSDINHATKVLFFNLGEKEAAMAFNTAEKLRSNGISCELYHENVKLDKQFKYAEKKDIPFIVILGSRELANGTAVIKQLSTGDQKELNLTEIIPYFQQH